MKLVKFLEFQVIIIKNHEHHRISFDNLKNNPANGTWINNLSIEHPTLIRKVNKKVENASCL